MRKHQNAAELQKCRKSLEPALAKQLFSKTAPCPPLAPLPSSTTAAPSHWYHQSKVLSFVASIQPTEQAGILMEASAETKRQVRLLILKGQKESSAGGYLRFRIYFISCTVTSAFYSPYDLGEMLCVCISSPTAEPGDIWRLVGPGLNSVGTARPPSHALPGHPRLL